MEFNCVCGAVINCDPRVDGAFDDHVSCEKCGSQYAISVTNIGTPTIE